MAKPTKKQAGIVALEQRIRDIGLSEIGWQGEWWGIAAGLNGVIYRARIAIKVEAFFARDNEHERDWPEWAFGISDGTYDRMATHPDWPAMWVVKISGEITAMTNNQFRSVFEVSP